MRSDVELTPPPQHADWKLVERRDPGGAGKLNQPHPAPVRLRAYASLTFSFSPGWINRLGSNNLSGTIPLALVSAVHSQTTTGGGLVVSSDSDAYIFETSFPTQWVNDLVEVCVASCRASTADARAQ